MNHGSSHLNAADFFFTWVEMTSQELCEDFESMVKTLEKRKTDNPLILVFSHVLMSFSGKSKDWLKTLHETCKNNKVLVLVLESSEVSLGNESICNMFPHDSSSASFGSASVWNVPTPQLINESAAAIIPSHDLDSMPAAAPAAVHGRQHGMYSAAAASPQFRRALSTEGPHCPDCKSPMTITPNRKGYNPGSKFWGCTQFRVTGCRGRRHAWWIMTRPAKATRCSLCFEDVRSSFISRIWMQKVLLADAFHESRSYM